MTIAVKIKEYRLQNKWTQEQLGELLNVSRSTVSSWEVGRNYPDISTLIEISNLFSVSIDTLLKEDNDMVNSIDFNKNQKIKFKLSIIILSVISIILLLVSITSYTRQPIINFETEETSSATNFEPFTREDIKKVSVKDNIVTVTFKSTLDGSYYGYFADGGGGEASLNLYKAKSSDKDSIEYEGKTQIDLSEMPKIKKLNVYVSQ